MLMIAIVFLGCSSDSSDDCQPITCLNGGISNSDCGCDCPQGYTGSNCNSQITPTRIKLNKVRIKYFPNTKTNGAAWDAGLSGNSINPDIFIRLGLGTGNNIGLIYESGVINNAISDGIINYDFIPTTNTYINMPTQTHTIILGDYDDIGSNEFMGGFTFVPYTSNNSFPATILLQDNSIPLSFELFVTYEW